MSQTARQFSRPNVLDGTDGVAWLPGPIANAKPDYLVCRGTAGALPTLQAAIDRAIYDSAIEDTVSGAKTRRVIHIAPGFYEGPAIVPASAPPLSLVGAGADKTLLAARIDAQMPGREFADRFGADFGTAHPDTQNHFATLAAREVLTTGNTSVLRIARDDTSVSGMTIRNLYACDRVAAAPKGAVPDAEGRFSQGQHQAVALHVAGADRVSLCDLTLESFQDTLYLQAGLGPSRTLLRDCTISGDVDFIFGGATGYFQNCTLRTRGVRGAQSWAVAPSTALHRPYGFVFDGCRFTHDGAETGQKGRSFLARQWFEGVRASPYGRPTLPGYCTRLTDRNHLDGTRGQISRTTLEAVGKCILVNSDLGDHINRAAPWDDWGGPAWSPRYRPVQANAAEFLRYLGDWLADNGAGYDDLEPDPPWLAVLLR
ncbi:pectinesterase family protein [Phaeobacter sp. J2-8]|uniref:pectinesterase family protein n=1 Tax=Phaeobacter sp. J2-8 TaxID=2931394 RepID=UPI001FD4283E|nr:pectinesterase family protein [Phaeobacter sp. J2-8]MCJ7874416.1 pectinesterase family protein [Phaeobacter sp. J2-8]